ncbi:MAG: GNAT family N-acetyltransferase [Gammaproteobacteria bacterium]|nr:GNAT family N-acetyltransferase [Gammaproteobacteria bacterium]
MQISDVTATDLDDVLHLNEDSVPHVSRVAMAEMEWFAQNAHYFRTVRQQGSLAGFLIGLRPGLPYDSPNYRWFSDNYRDFGYVDRVAVAATARRRGVASLLYEDFASTLTGTVDVMTCEVNLRPPNDSSMKYHEQQGFVQVASQETDGGDKEVALMEKKL